MKKNTRGFSLIELLIVIVIIGILASLAIAGLLASKRSANEGSAVSTMRLIHGAQMTYATSYGSGEYAGDIGGGTLTAFNVIHGLGLVDDVVGSGSKSGYNFVGGREVATTSSPAQFFFSAIPISSNSTMGTGNSRFAIATDGVVRTDQTLTAHFANAAAVFAAPAYGN
ncbi:hypothetical protein BH10ACI2_BH10ACI2_00960 [soil metagenome]